MIGDDRSRTGILKVDQQQINEQLRKLSDQIARIEGRSGGIKLRDSITVQSEKQTLMDFESSTSGNASIVSYGTENATIAFAKGARKEDNGEWIATDTSATIWALDRAGNGTLYSNSGLTVGQAFEPTVAFIVGVDGSVSDHAVAGTGTPHTASGLTAGHVLRATAATTFAWGAAAAADITNTPAGNIAATNVQTALNELDTEKVDLTGDAMTGDLSITSAASNPQENLAITNTNADELGGGIKFKKLSASPADGDQLGTIRFAGYDSGNTLTNFARITGVSTIVTDSSEAGKIEFGVANAGAVTVYVKLDPNVLTLTSATAANPYLDIENTNADAGSATVRLSKISASPANSDECGHLLFSGYSSTSARRTYGDIYGVANNVSNTGEYGVIYFSTINAGSASIGQYIAGPDVYIYGNVSALTITDRTKAPKDKAESYTIIDSFDRKNGELDKDKLNKAAKIEFDDYSDPTKPSKKSTARDLSMVVSALMEVVKDLAVRVEALETP